MWEINNFFQLLSLARSAGLGVLLCLCYDILRSARKTFSFSTIAIFFQDVIFFLVSAFVTFLFLLSVTNGEIRAFVLFGIAFGFALSRFTISKIFYLGLKFILIKIRAGFTLISNFFYKCFDSFEANGAKIFKKWGETLKKLLKRGKGLLYTKGDRKIREL